MKSDAVLFLELIGVICLIGMMFVIAPFIGFWCAYFGGWLTKLTIGNILCRALALIGISIIPDQIPLLAGGLGWIGGFFKSYTNYKRRKED